MRNFIRTYPGHSIWKLNLLTGEITVESTFKKEEDNIVSVEKEETFWYLSALNKDAAMRKFNAMARRAFEKINPPQ